MLLAAIMLAAAQPFVPGPFTVRFAGDSLRVDAAAAADLDNAAAAWRLRASDRIRLTGGASRVDPVRAYLMNRGVPATVIATERGPGPRRVLVVFIPA